MAGELTTLSLSMGLGIVSDGVVPVPPTGFVWQLDDDGQYLLDDDGTLRMEEA